MANIPNHAAKPSGCNTMVCPSGSDPKVSQAKPLRSSGSPNSITCPEKEPGIGITFDSVMPTNKTGTVTSGRMTLVDVVTDGFDQREALELVGALEGASEHPIGRAIAALFRLLGQDSPHLVAGRGRDEQGNRCSRDCAQQE